MLDVGSDRAQCGLAILHLDAFVGQWLPMMQKVTSSIWEKAKCWRNFSLATGSGPLNHQQSTALALDDRGVERLEDVRRSHELCSNEAIASGAKE
jgi:hypothetical protein